jgi:hypothetical protein
LPVSIIEVDCTRPANRPICDANVPSGYPTLKLVQKSILTDEYHGVRDAVSMFSWLKRAVAFVYEDARVVRISSKPDMDKFLLNLIGRPVVIACMTVSTPLEILAEWNTTVNTMRERSARNVAFVSVPDWTVLVGSRESSAWANYTAGFPFGENAPFAIGSNSATDLIRRGEATWWFNGVTGADSLGTFMHLSTMSPAGGGRLVDANAEFVSATMQWTLVVLFDTVSGPSWVLEDKMAAFSRYPWVMPVYSRPSDVPAFRDHLGFEHRVVVKPEDNGKVDFAIYRAASGGVEKVRYTPGLPIDHASLRSWAGEYAQWGVNMTSRASDHVDDDDESDYKIIQRARLAPRLPGSDNIDLNMTSVSSNARALVNVRDVVSKPVSLVASTWSRTVERDGRSLLLLLYRKECPACRAFMPIFESTAHLLATDSDAGRSVFAARMHISSNDLPPYIERPERVPVVYMVVAGVAPVLYGGPMRADDIAAFSRQHAAPPHVRAALSDAAALRVTSSGPGPGFSGALAAILLVSVGVWLMGAGIGVELKWSGCAWKTYGSGLISPTKATDESRALMMSLGEIKVQ